MDPSVFIMHELKTGEPVQHPSYMSVWPFERTFQLTEWRSWFHSNWKLSIYLSLVYILVVFSIKFCMYGRKPYTLRWTLFFWNLFLAIFSFIGTFRTVAELINVYQTHKEPLYTAICLRDYRNVAAGFWTLLFTLSKALELGDTIFIVLRKQPLIFIHWYHHVTVLCYCWSTFSNYDSTGACFVTMNFAVHALMYTYYALRSLQIPIPRFLAKAITCLQLVQMSVGIGCNVFALLTKLLGYPCATDVKHIYIGFVMYASYLILFANFFRDTYLRKKNKKTD